MKLTVSLIMDIKTAFRVKTASRIKMAVRVKTAFRVRLNDTYSISHNGHKDGI